MAIPIRPARKYIVFLLFTRTLIRTQVKVNFDLIVEISTVSPRSLYTLYIVTCFIDFIRTQVKVNFDPIVEISTVSLRSLDTLYIVTCFIDRVCLLGHIV